MDLCHDGIRQSGRHRVCRESVCTLSEKQVLGDTSNKYRQESNQCEVDDRVDGVVVVVLKANRCVFEREVAASASGKPWRKSR
jgi:hypothetical protein